jgi:DNA modification methylase
LSVSILIGDCRERLRELPSGSVHTCVTSPPYFGLRDYGVDGQIGLELTPDAFVAELVSVFREVRRVLRDDGTLWLNLGDSYAGSWGAQGHRVTESDAASWHGSQIKNHPKRATGTGSIRQAGLKPKDLIGIPWRVAFALQADGWFLRQDIIWSKPNPMPESVTDRCTKAHEYVFLLSKSPRYHFDAAAIAEPADCPEGPGNIRQKYTDEYNRTGDERLRTKAGLVNIGARATRNKRSVWTVGTKPFAEAHFATYPPELIEPCILAGCPVGGTVLDPFGGAGTTGMVADRLGRNAVLIELNPEYAAIAQRRIEGDAGMFSAVEVAA